MRTPPNHLRTTSDHQLSSRHVPDKILSQITQIVKMPIAALQNDQENGQNGQNNGQNGQVGVSREAVLLRVHVTALDEAVHHNIYTHLGVHLCCLSCHSGCNNVCEGNLEEHMAGHFTDHMIIMHVLHHHPRAVGYALWHNSILRTFDFVGENGLLDFIHSRNGFL